MIRTKIVYEPKIVELKKNMAVVLPYEIEIHNGRLYDILAVDDEGQLLFANSKSYYVKNEKGEWYKPFVKKN